jgi:hypothetical protein
MADNRPTRYELNLKVNNIEIHTILIGRHYLEKHESYMNDELNLNLVASLDGGVFPMDSITDGTEYFTADVEWGSPAKIYRIIWLFEGDWLEILGVVNAYRRVSKKK